MDLPNVVRVILRILLANRAALVVENLALRQQLAVVSRTATRPRLLQRDRIFWVWVSRLWKDWRSALVLVQPDTVVRWHRRGFRLYWRWKSRNRGRPTIDPVIRKLIRRMSRENPLWGAPRIQAELALLGHYVAESTVAKYMVRRRSGPPSQTWRSFLKNHVDCTAACDFFVVPTATFRLLYCFVVLMHGRRRIVHFNVTTHPTAHWTAQQIVEAFPADGSEPRYLLRDRDGIYGSWFQQRVSNMGIRPDPHLAAIAVAESVRRASDRFYTTRVFESCNRAERSTPQANPSRLHRLLPRRSTSQPTGWQFTDGPRSRAAVQRASDRDPAGGRVAPPLRPRCLNRKVTHIS